MIIFVERAGEICGVLLLVKKYVQEELSMDLRRIYIPKLYAYFKDKFSKKLTPLPSP